ncbi:MAG TPA: OB-fold domain-containing protein [Acidimicrobiales bacterium]|nr:OB-fold domain-containing protein [Acidimicrobiales bacterium]
MPDPVSAEFWAAAASHVLAIQRCTDCGWYAYPPNVVCSNCLAREPSFRYEPVSGRGRVTTWTVVHQAFLPGFAADIPYVVAEVELAEQEGLRVIARLAGVRHRDLAIGTPVEVAFDDVAAGIAVPRFVSAAERA